ncbi:aminodeoxychorismate/anthranilate synthase component II [Alphaproteobacteria bacterium]|nr:aminodeoxychorismate/anthranilate synthase component II [Alphaproteobacteria bacterium]
MFLLLDNYDSFTWNIYHYMSSFDVKVDVIRNDKINSKRVILNNYNGIIFSPGPGRPENAGNMMNIIKDCYENIPMLGICLGHQAIGMFFGAKIIKMKNVMHGRTDTMKWIKKNSLLKKIPNKFIATRYHSLEISNKNLPPNIEISAVTSKNNIMAIKIRDKKIYGLQFHPESISTMYGQLFFKNFILECNKVNK